MGLLLYSLLLLFLVPANIVACRKVNAGKPLGAITNKIVVNQLHLTNKLKGAYWVIFYFFHLWFLIVAADRGAFLSCFLLGGYMAITPMLQSALRKKNWSITSVPVAQPGAPVVDPIVAAPPTGYTAQGSVNLAGQPGPGTPPNMGNQPPPLM